MRHPAQFIPADGWELINTLYGLLVVFDPPSDAWMVNV